MGFNPLFVGKGFAPRAGSCKRIQGFGVSIPYSSGKVLLLTELTRYVIMSTRVSIPYSSGKVLLPARWPTTAVCPRLGVSIPYSSGKVLLPATAGHRGRYGGQHNVSIPYSSGKVLLPSPVRSSTWPQWADVSIPYSSGKVLLQKFVPKHKRTSWPACFNPLFVGKGFAPGAGSAID